MVAAGAFAIGLAWVPVPPAAAAHVCELPASISLQVEERTLLDARGVGLVVAGSPAPTTGLRSGDVIVQANGRRTTSCADIEAVAADALAKGLLVLLAAERDGRTVALALVTSGTAVVAAAPPVEQPAAPLPSSATAERPLAAPPPPLPTAVSTPVAAREVSLPPRAGTSAEIAAKAVAAAAVLASVDEAARFAVPLATYERRVDETTNAIAALHIDGEGSGPVRAAIAEAIAYHETARDVRRWKASALADARVDQRSAAGASLPYFSDSDVPRWMERYPFLSESLQQAPRTTHMLLPGEMPGRWNPDQAVELLWDRASKAAARLAAWGAGK